MTNKDKKFSTSIKTGNLNSKLLNREEIERILKGKKRINVAGEILLFRTITGHYPHKILYPKIIEVIKGIPDAERILKQRYIEWVARGYNPRSVLWIPGLERDKLRNEIDPTQEYPARVLIEAFGYGSEELKHWKVCRTEGEIAYMRRI